MVSFVDPRSSIKKALSTASASSVAMWMGFGLRGVSLSISTMVVKDKSSTTPSNPCDDDGEGEDVMLR